MIEEQVLEKILLNLGGDAPELVVVFMLVKWVWPKMAELFEAYLQAKATSAAAIAATPATITVRLDDSFQGFTDALTNIIQAVKNGKPAGASPAGQPSVVSPPGSSYAAGMASQAGGVGSKSESVAKPE